VLEEEEKEEQHITKTRNPPHTSSRCLSSKAKRSNRYTAQEDADEDEETCLPIGRE